MAKAIGIALISIVMAVSGVTFTYAHGTMEKGAISPAELAKMLGTYTVIDIRPEGEYVTSHIPTAVSVPLLALSQQTLATAGVDKTEPVVLYGTSSTAPQKAKLLLEVLGYTDIRILAGGFTHWSEDGHPTESGPDHRATAAKVENPGIAEKLESVPKSYDFGLIEKENGTVTTQFELRNMANRSVQVVDISTSCGCTSAKIEKPTIAPGEAAAVTVFFDPNFHKEPQGRFSRTVFLQLDTGEEVSFRIFVEIAGNRG